MKSEDSISKSTFYFYSFDNHVKVSGKEEFRETR